MPKRTIAALVLIETDDARLFPESPATRGELLRALLETQPEPEAVIAIMDPSEARQMLAAHIVAAHLDEHGAVVRYLADPKAASQ
jgi:hypothetical protein